MIIAIDASRAVKAQPTGTELYSARMIEYLAKVDQDNTYYLYTNAEPPQSLAKLPRNFIWKVIPFPRLWTHLRLPLALYQDRPDILFVPSHALPLICPVKKVVVTLHDVAYEVFPEAYSGFGLWYQRFTARAAIRKAAAIIAPSEATKRDLVKVFHARSDGITVVHHGFDDTFSKKTSIPEKIQKLQPYFLCIGRLEARKNTKLLIEAFARFRQDQADTTERLVLIGKPGYGYGEVEQAIAILPKRIQEAIIRPGYVDAHELPAYMQAANAFVFPSLYEGFGIPILEAMAAGTPVLTSDISANPEVADDAAILVDPESVADIAKHLALLASDELTRTELAKRGKARAAEFSWVKMAEQTHKILVRVAKESHA